MASMADSVRPRSPFAANIELFDDTPIRSVAPEELARILKAHEIYLDSDRRSGRRANLDSTDLSGQSFSGMKLRRVRMSRAKLMDADFTGADLRRANLIGAKLQRGRLTSADLTRGRLSGINLADANCDDACLAEADIEFGILANAVLRNADLHDADLSGVILDGADLSRGEPAPRQPPGAFPCGTPVSTAQICGMPEWVAPSSPGPRSEGRISVALISGWRNSTSSTFRGRISAARGA